MLMLILQKLLSSNLYTQWKDCDLRYKKITKAKKGFYAKKNTEPKKKLKELRDLQIPFLENDSHIIPIHLYDPRLCKEAANLLLERHGIYIQPIFFPTVPKGDERFRVTITPRHEANDINNFLNALDDVWKTMDLRRSDAIEEEKPAVSRIY